MGMIPPEACRMAKLRIFIDNMPSQGRYFIPSRHICPILTWHSWRCPVYLPYPDNHVITVRARGSCLVVRSLEETQLLAPTPGWEWLPHLAFSRRLRLLPHFRWVWLSPSSFAPRQSLATSIWQMSWWWNIMGRCKSGKVGVNFYTLQYEENPKGEFYLNRIEHISLHRFCLFGRRARTLDNLQSSCDETCQ